MNQDILLAVYGYFSGTPALAFIAAFFAEWFPYLLILLAAWWAFRYRHNDGTILSLFHVFAPASLAWLLVDVIKRFFPSPRPFAEIDLTPLISVSDPLGAFPSGHATAFAALGMTIFLRDKKSGAWFLVGALLVGLARIAAGVHYPGDILAGFLLGGAIAILIHLIWIKLSEKPASPQ